MTPRNFPIKSTTIFLDLNLPHSCPVHYCISTALQYNISLQPISTVFPSIFLDLNQNMLPCFWEQLPSSELNVGKAPLKVFLKRSDFVHSVKKFLYFCECCRFPTFCILLFLCEFCIFLKKCSCWRAILVAVAKVHSRNNDFNLRKVKN